MYIWVSKKLQAIAQIHLFAGQFFYYCNSKKQVALNAFQKIYSRAPVLDELYACYYFRKLSEQEFVASEENVDIINYCTFEQCHADTKRLDERCTRAILSFWQELLSSHYDMSRLHRIANTINAAMSIAQDKYKRLIKLNSTSESILRQYASFLIEIANDTVQGTMYTIKADELEDTRTKTTASHTRRDALLDADNAVIVASGDRLSMGEIVNANLGASKMLACSRSEIVGSNLSSIMPVPYSTYHTGWLRAYSDTGKSDLVNARPKHVFALSRSGYLVWVELSVREFASSVAQLMASSGLVAGDGQHLFQSQSLAGGATHQITDTSYLGVLKRVAKDEYRALMDPMLRIMNCTENCAALFSIQAEEMRSGMVPVTGLIPAFEDPQVQKQLRSSEGYTTKVPGKAESYVAYVEPLGVVEENWRILRFVSTATKLKSRFTLGGALVEGGQSSQTLKLNIDSDDDGDDDFDGGSESDVNSNEANMSDNSDEQTQPIRRGPVPALTSTLSSLSSLAFSPTTTETSQVVAATAAAGQHAAIDDLSPLVRVSSAGPAPRSALRRDPIVNQSNPNHDHSERKAVRVAGFGFDTGETIHTTEVADNVSQGSSHTSAKMSKSALLQHRIRKITNTSAGNVMEPMLMRVRYWIGISVLIMVVASIVRASYVNQNADIYLKHMVEMQVRNTHILLLLF
jgi:hypothetical protein